MAVHLYGQNVLTLGVEVRRDVELGQIARVFGETYVLAVHVKIEERIHAVEVDVHFLVLPSGGYAEGAAVRSHLVAVVVAQPVLGRGAHHAAFPIAHLHAVLEDDTLVGVERCAVFLRTVFTDAGHVPVHGYVHEVPS